MSTVGTPGLLGLTSITFIPNRISIITRVVIIAITTTGTILTMSTITVIILFRIGILIIRVAIGTIIILITIDKLHQIANHEHKCEEGRAKGMHLPSGA